jgi:hypothetical protein
MDRCGSIDRAAQGELRETAHGEASLENKFSPGVRGRGEATDGDSFSFLDRESIEALQNISAPEELNGKRDTSTY